jgi:hypothetical protein
MSAFAFQLRTAARRPPSAALLAALALAACQPQPPRVGKPAAEATLEEDPAWQKVATPEDVGKLERAAAAWAEALAEARKAGFTRQIRAEGDLLNPDAALPRAAPPPGSYNCRVIRLGTVAPRGRAFVAHKPFFCHVGVNGDQLSITKQTGSQRPGGYLWDTDDTKRLIFLGSLALGTEDAPLAYGEDAARNMAGIFERYGDFRYRLVVPWPRQDSKLDVFELIPLPPQS